MAYWVGGGGDPHDATITSLHIQARGTYYQGGKRSVSRSSDETYYDQHHYFSKRSRLETWGSVVDHDYTGRHDCDRRQTHSAPHRGQSTSQPFIVIREGSSTPDHPQTTGAAGSCAMERTESGLSISSDTTQHSRDDEDDEHLLSDSEAARLVRDHVASVRRRHPDSRQGRILRALISPKSRGADFALDDTALRSIFSAANDLFFAKRLTGRVAWDWSHPANAQYESQIVGTTALRQRPGGAGYETLIVLSSPILKDTSYNRRLLISTFLHEMIHSFLFVACGLKAHRCGGHTDGFRQIAGVIDGWVGAERLRLCDMEADLGRFRGDGQLAGVPFRSPPELAYDDDGTSSRGSAGAPWSALAQQDGWDGLSEAPHPQRRRSCDGWRWHRQEGFPAGGGHGTGPSSSYVY